MPQEAELRLQERRVPVQEELRLQDLARQVQEGLEVPPEEILRRREVRRARPEDVALRAPREGELGGAPLVPRLDKARERR